MGQGTVSPAFVTSTAGKLRLVVNYSRVKESLEDQTSRVDLLGDLAAVLDPSDILFRAEISDAYYHLRIRGCDRERLTFKVGSVVYLPICLNCGLSVAPWFLIKAMKPVVAHLREKGHRVFSYLDDFFCAASSSSTHGASAADRRVLGDEIIALFAKLGLLLHTHKCDFSGSRRLEILGIVVDSKKELFLLGVSKDRGTGVSAITVCLATTSARTRDRHQEVCWPWKIRHTRCGGCAPSSARAVQLLVHWSQSHPSKITQKAIRIICIYMALKPDWHTIVTFLTVVA